MPHTWIDGVAAHEVPADDRGLNYADGAFETLYCTDGKIACRDLHQTRLGVALERLNFSAPRELVEQCFNEMEQLLTEAAHSGVVRLTLTRGSGPRGYAPSDATNPRRIVMAQDFPPRSHQPLHCGVAQVHWADQPQLAGLKLLARTEQVLAAGEARQQGWDDALMLDGQGRVISSSRANLFITRDGQFLTPSLERCGIAGTRRQLLLDTVLPALGHTAKVQDLTIDDVLNADAVMLTNTVMGITSVGSIAQQAFNEEVAEGLLRPLQRALSLIVTGQGQS